MSTDSYLSGRHVHWTAGWIRAGTVARCLDFAFTGALLRHPVSAVPARRSELSLHVKPKSCLELRQRVLKRTNRQVLRVSRELVIDSLVEAPLCDRQAHLGERSGHVGGKTDGRGG